MPPTPPVTHTPTPPHVHLQHKYNEVKKNFEKKRVPLSIVIKKKMRKKRGGERGGSENNINNLNRDDAIFEHGLIPFTDITWIIRDNHIHNPHITPLQEFNECVNQ